MAGRDKSSRDPGTDEQGTLPSSQTDTASESGPSVVDGPAEQEPGDRDRPKRPTLQLVTAVPEPEPSAPSEAREKPPRRLASRKPSARKATSKMATSKIAAGKLGTSKKATSKAASKKASPKGAAAKGATVMSEAGADGAELGTETARGGHGPRSAVDDARRLLADADPVAYYKALSGLARQGHHSLLQALPYTPSLEFHDPSCVVVEPKPAGVDTVELFAGAAYPQFSELLVSTFERPEVAAQLDGVYQLMFGEGANVAVVTNHGQIIDIALVGGAMIVSMCQQGRSFGVLGEHLSVEDLAVRINVMVSRMVTTRQVFNIPALQVLQCGARTFLSVPQTHSRRRAKLDPALVRANNLLVRHELDARLSEGGQMLLMAASGSQDLSLAASMAKRVRTQWKQRRGMDPGESETLHLQPLYDGTMNLMLGCRYVLPIAVSLDPGAPALEVGGLTRVRTKDDCHRIMEWIAEAHQAATEVPTIYHRHEDDLLTQVRSLVKL